MENLCKLAYTKQLDTDTAASEFAVATRRHKQGFDKLSHQAPKYQLIGSSAPASLNYSLLFFRRAATAADSAANPVPNRTTVIGSGTGTGPEGGDTIGVDVSVTVGTGVAVSVTGGTVVSVGVATDVFVAVGVGVSVGGTPVSVGVGVAGSVAAVSVTNA